MRHDRITVGHKGIVKRVKVKSEDSEEKRRVAEYLSEHLDNNNSDTRKRFPKIVMLGEDGSVGISCAISSNQHYDTTLEGVIPNVAPIHSLDIGDRQAMMHLMKSLNLQKSFGNKNIVVIGSYREKDAPQVKTLLKSIMESAPELLVEDFIHTIYMLGVKNSKEEK